VNSYTTPISEMHTMESLAMAMLCLKYQRYRVYIGVYLATLLSEILVTSFMVNFLEPEEPSIYGYGYAPRYISELVANQGNSVKTLQ